MKRLVRYIAVDFDGTITNHDAVYPAVGSLRDGAKEALRYFKNNDCVLMLWTCRENKELDMAMEFLKENNLEFDFINENCPERIKLYNSDCRKIGCDVFIDDKNYNTIDVNWHVIINIAKQNWIMGNDNSNVMFK